MSLGILGFLLAVALSAGPLLGGDPDLVLHVGFDGDVDDDSTSGAHGVPVGGLSYTVGVLGLAADFDGVDAAVTFPTFPDGFLSTNDFTIAFRFNVSTSGDMSVVSKRPVCNAAPFIDVQGQNGSMRMEIADGTPGAARVVEAPYTAGWHHFVGIREGTQIRAYLDWGLVDEDTTPILYDLTNTIALGLSTSPCVGVDGTVMLSGLLDDLRVYTRALTADEVLGLEQIFADGFE